MTHKSRWLLLALLAAPPASAQVPPSVNRSTATATPEHVLANDNRAPAGTLRRGILAVRLEARLAAWRPDLDVDSAVTVQAFAEEGGAPRIPGPLVRAREGTEVHVRLRNSLDSTLVVHGLRAGTVTNDTLHVAAGAVREVRFRARVPGTYLYWGRTTEDSIHYRTRRDSQLTGAIVIDPPGFRPNPAERIFVMTVIDVYQDSVRNPAKEDIWELAINGRSWPHTERLEYAVGDTVRWRWLNGTYLPHPMHLHGFHFRVLAKGDGDSDTTYVAGAERLAVTEFMVAGSTFRMDWVPTRSGNWLMHCHMIPHITPYPERADTARGHDVHHVERHPLTAMAGLVLGVTTMDRNGAAESSTPTPTRRLRLLAQQAPADSGRDVPRGYVLQRGTEPLPDSVEVTSSPLVLTRGETTAITVVNRLSEPTTVHWHGMELESVYDGVSGWSRTGSNLAPLLPPGDSFTVTFTPPRAGTFIYHTHMDEGAQLGTGLYGPLLVLEPGERHDPGTDLVFMIGGAVVADSAKPALNGHRDPPPLTLHAGTRYRLRFINILSAAAARVELSADSVPVSWRALAKDGADLPAALRLDGPAHLRRLGVGETYDFEWTPTHPMDALLEVRSEGTVLRQMMRVQWRAQWEWAARASGLRADRNATAFRAMKRSAAAGSQSSTIRHHEVAGRSAPSADPTELVARLLAAAPLVDGHSDRLPTRYPNDFAIAAAAAEARRIHAAEPIAIVPTIEFAARLENSLEVLRAFYGRGLRAVTVPYRTNDLADGAGDAPRHGGLSTLGRMMVAEMNHLGEMRDVSHISDSTMHDVLEVSLAPVIFTHSSARAVVDVPRNVPDDVLPRVAGIDHVGIGSGCDGIDFKVRESDDASTFPALLEELVRRGWTDEELRKLAGENFLRALEQAEAVAGRIAPVE